MSSILNMFLRSEPGQKHRPDREVDEEVDGEDGESAVAEDGGSETGRSHHSTGCE